MRVQLRIYTTPELDISFNLHTPKDRDRSKSRPMPCLPRRLDIDKYIAALLFFNFRASTYVREDKSDA